MKSAVRKDFLLFSALTDPIGIVVSYRIILSSQPFEQRDKELVFLLFFFKAFIFKKFEIFFFRDRDLNIYKYIKIVYIDRVE